MIVKSSKGRPVDFSQLAAQNEGKVALGNASMNARGDIVSPTGEILTTAQTAAQEYHRNNPNAVRQVSIRDLADATTFADPSVAVADLSPDVVLKSIPKKKVVDQ